MTRVRFVSADGATVREVDAAPGERLLDIAQAEPAEKATPRTSEISRAAPRPSARTFRLP